MIDKITTVEVSSDHLAELQLKARKYDLLSKMLAANDEEALDVLHDLMNLYGVSPRRKRDERSRQAGGGS